MGIKDNRNVVYWYNKKWKRVHIVEFDDKWDVICFIVSYWDVATYEKRWNLTIRKKNIFKKLINFLWK